MLRTEVVPTNGLLPLAALHCPLAFRHALTVLTLLLAGAGATIPTVRKAALQDTLAGLVRRVLDHEKKAAVSFVLICRLMKG